MNDKMLEFTKGFAGNTLGPIPIQDAVKRIVTFCCSPQSGFLAYDLVGDVARKTGRLSEIGPWSILLADALAGRVDVQNLHGFISNMGEFAKRINVVPDRDLAAMNYSELLHVVNFCTFGFPGAWAPKITKVGALFRPRSVPILDGYLALAFGYSRDGFSVGKQSRRYAIELVIRALAREITDQTPTLAAVRRQAEQQVPAVKLLPDLRLADIIIWTSQDDRMQRQGKKLNAWLDAKPGKPPSIDDVMWLPLLPGNPDGELSHIIASTVKST